MLVFCANALPQVINTQGLRQFALIQQKLQPFLIINQCVGDIETRAKYFEKQLNKINKPIHIISYGLAGLDLRYVLSQNNNIQAKSLITIGTPHRGSILSRYFQTKQVDYDIIDPICKVLGIKTQYFDEINPSNIRDFNLFATNQENIKYYSINSETVVQNMSQIYHVSGNMIEDLKEYPIQSGSDGIFAYDETKWGQHIATLDCDHGSLIGIPKTKNGEQTIDIIKQLVE